MEKKRHMVVAAVHLILIRRNRILLLRRFNTGWGDGKYSVIAGHLDGNETIRSATSREAVEEAGIRVSMKDLDFVHVMHRKSAGERRKKDEERIDFFLKTEKWRGVPRNMEPDRCDDLHWFSLDNLPHPMVPYVRHAIDNIRDGIFYSEFGWRA